MNTTLTKLSAIKRNPNNPRVLKDEKLDKLVRSIKNFPEMLDIRPIVVNDDMVVLGGNMRLKACKEAGLKEVPVMKVSALTEEQQREFIIKDNVGFGEWDWELLQAEWDNDLLEDWGLDLDFDPVDDKEGLTDEDDTPEVTENPVSKAGDIWLLGEHRVMCGDSTNSDNVNSLIDNNQIDLVYTDPPYGIDEKGDRTGRNTGLAKNHNFKDFKDDSIDYAVKATKIVDKLDINNQVWWGANYYCHFLPQSNNWFIWDKRVEEKMKDTQSDCEMAWVKSKWSSVRIFRHLWKGFNKDSERGQSRVHPTQKPVALAEWSFDYFKEVSSVMDLFGGSGSTLIACENTKRKCYVMEFDEHYCDVIIKRWQEYTGKKAVHAESGDEFVEVDNGKI